MRQIQWVFVDAWDPAAPTGSVQMQNKGRIIGVQWNLRPEMTLAAADRFTAEVELSTNAIKIADNSLAVAGNGIISRCVVQAAADVAGTSVAISSGCDQIYPADFPVSVGTLLYVVGGYIAQTSAGAGLIYGYIGIHLVT